MRELRMSGSVGTAGEQSPAVTRPQYLGLCNGSNAYWRSLFGQPGADYLKFRSDNRKRRGADIQARHSDWPFVAGSGH